MEPPVLSPAEKEIALRGRIIEALVTANEQLQQRNAFLVSFIASKWSAYSLSEKEMLEKWLGYSLSERGNAAKESGYTVAEKEKASPESGYAVTEKGNTSTELGYSIPEKEKILPESGYTVAENGNGTTEFSYAIAEKGKASPGFGYSFTETVRPSPELGYTVPEKGNGSQQLSVSLPEKIDVSKVSYSSIAAKVRAATGYKGRKSALKATALLFVHLYNGGGGGYPELSRVTHLSVSGLAKLLMSLRKRGLIKNKAYRQPALTEMSLNILRQAYAGSVKP